MSMTDIDPAITPYTEKLLSITDLAKRWNVQPKVAFARAQKYRIRIIAFNSRSRAVRLSEVLRVEEEAQLQLT